MNIDRNPMILRHDIDPVYKKISFVLRIVSNLPHFLSGIRLTWIVRFCGVFGLNLFCTFSFSCAKNVQILSAIQFNCNQKKALFLCFPTKSYLMISEFLRIGVLTLSGLGIFLSQKPRGWEV